METFEGLPNQEIGLVEKPNGKAVSDVKVWEEKKANFRNDISAYPRKDGNFKVEKADGFAKDDSNVSKARKAQSAEPIDPLEQKACKKATSHDEDNKQLVTGKEHSSLGSKKKSKGSQSAEVPKDSSQMDSYLGPKNRKSTYANNYLSKGEMEDSKLQKYLFIFVDRIFVTSYPTTLLVIPYISKNKGYFDIIFYILCELYIFSLAV